MRRARIKAIATVPTRRKAIPEISTKESTSENDEKKKSAEEINESSVSCLTLNTNDHNEESKERVLTLITSKEIQNEKAEGDKIPTGKKVTICPDIQANNISSAELHATENIASVPQITQNRSCFTRPMPRLDSTAHTRRNSTQGSGASASESEDDNRKSNVTIPSRTQNDAPSSLQGSKDISNEISRTDVPKTKVGQKRRIFLSESARKLAEARREFYIKHENKAPDRSKLTMYDLIYYNPATNPMKKSKEGSSVVKKDSPSPTVQVQEEEIEDDPSAMPVPQVKVGPDGMLIIDEQSLVIEQTNAKKSREVLSKEAIIDDDNNGSGFYKRRQKSKDWSKWETLKFYKALNTVGTDFLLMQSLFPNRTRQEIKLKFKKEEKINRKLVEKALVYHQEFDIESLEKELATVEETEQEQLSTLEKLKHVGQKSKKRAAFAKKRIRRFAAASIAETDVSEDELDRVQEQNDDSQQDQEGKAEQEETVEEESQSNKRPSSQSDNETDSIVATFSPSNDSGSETEIYQVRPTRSGRLPKVRKLQGPDVNMLDIVDSSTNYKMSESLENNDELETLSSSENIKAMIHYPTSIKNVIPDIDQVEPGSLVILTKESSEEPGKTVLQVYMVSSSTNPADESEKRSITPVNLSPELLATVTNKLIDAEPLSVKKECD